MNVCHGNGEARGLATLKKRLFIIACNVATAALLLLYVTYSQYRISIEATVQMPQAAQIYAALTLSPNQSAGATVDSMSTFLSDLAPGDDPMTFATAEGGDSNHRFTVTVSNAQTVGDKPVPSEVAMDYRLRVYSTGHIPLKMVLVVEKEGGTKDYYLSYKYETTPPSGDDHSKYTYYFVSQDKRPDSDPLTLSWITREEQVFTIPANTAQTHTYPANTAQTHTYQIYCGWDPSDEDGDYRKEVEHLEIRAELVSKKGEMNSSWQPNEGIIIYQPVPETPQGGGT